MAGPNLLLAFTIASVLTIVLDIDRPRRGFINVNQSSMERVSQYIKSGKMPPMPDDLASARAGAQEIIALQTTEANK